VPNLILRVVLVVAVIIGAKLLFHFLGWEVLSLNPLFSGIVAANVFVMGFLLSGVLADYKESERLPGELAASIETIAEEMVAIHRTSNAPTALQCVVDLRGLASDILDWLHKKHRTHDLLDDLNRIGDYFVAVEKFTQANFIVRLKQEQSAIRRVLIRIHSVRETSFVASGYLAAHVTTALVGLGLVLVKIDPFYESLFFVGVIGFLLTFLILLIHDLDNPFGYHEAGSNEDVSLKPLEDVVARLDRRLNEPRPQVGSTG
jgi:hypothetical protein